MTKSEGKTGQWDLKIICPGYPRSGTKSLAFALDMLGYGPVWHCAILSVKEMKHLEWWNNNYKSINNGEYVNFDEFYKITKCHSTMDVPTGQYWYELSQYYPNSKIIICVRNDFDKWRKSVDKIFHYAMNSKLISIAYHILGISFVQYIREIYMPKEIKKYAFKNKDEYDSMTK